MDPMEISKIFLDFQDHINVEQDLKEVFYILQKILTQE
jgi:hypothetical protein